MTFIYRQLKSAEEKYNPIVLCSDKLENREKFPFDKVYLMRRNFIGLKKSRLFSKIYGYHTLLSLKPKLSSGQIKYFKNILSGNKINLIHAHFGPSGLEIFKIAKELNIPIIVSFHGYDASVLLTMEEYRKNIKDVFDNSYVIAVSEYMKKSLVAAGAPEDNIRLIRYGVPLDYFNFVQRKPIKLKIKSNEIITFLQVSNFVEKKGHKYTVLAFNELLKYNKSVKLILAGDGYLREGIEKLCADLNISEYVDFPGLVDTNAVRSLMSKADIFLHHSVESWEGDKEGIPNVIIEAMSTGLPVISTYHSGIPELIDNNENGFLVNEKDVESYSQILINLEKIPEDIGIRARVKVEEEFDLEKQINKLLSLYNTLLNLYPQ